MTIVIWQVSHWVHVSEKLTLQQTMTALYNVVMLFELKWLSLFVNEEHDLMTYLSSDWCLSTALISWNVVDIDRQDYWQLSQRRSATANQPNNGNRRRIKETADSEIFIANFNMTCCVWTASRDRHWAAFMKEAQIAMIGCHPSCKLQPIRQPKSGDYVV